MPQGDAAMCKVGQADLSDHRDLYPEALLEEPPDSGDLSTSPQWRAQAENVGLKGHHSGLVSAGGYMHTTLFGWTLLRRNSLRRVRRREDSFTLTLNRAVTDSVGTKGLKLQGSLGSKAWSDGVTRSIQL